MKSQHVQAPPMNPSGDEHRVKDTTGYALISILFVISLFKLNYLIYRTTELWRMAQSMELEGRPAAAGEVKVLASKTATRVIPGG